MEKAIQHEAVIGLLRQASDLIMNYYRQGHAQATLKSDQSPVTEADLASHHLITDGLTTLFPDIPVLSEESSHAPYEIRKNYSYVWVLDPLDGTKEFIRRTDEFSINLALIYNGKPVAGYIHLPVYNKTYYAVAGQGAREISEQGDIAIQTARFSLQDRGLKVVGSRSHMDALTQTYIDKLDQPELIALGSALKFISIAKGDAHYYPRMVNIMEWDTAAGQIIIEEAGGSLVDAHTGEPLSYNKQNLSNPYFIASGQQI